MNSSAGAKGAVSLHGRHTLYRGYRITYDPPPIPVRTCDWHFVHEDYDEGDRRHGSAASLNAAKNEIDLIEDEAAADPWKLTRDLAEVRERLSETGNVEMRDYYRRSAFELRCLLAERS